MIQLVGVIQFFAAQYTTAYHSIPQYTTVYHSIPQYTTVYHCTIQQETFEGENFHKFYSFVAIRASYFHEIWECGVFCMAQASNPQKSYFHQVFSLDSFPLYGMTVYHSIPQCITVYHSVSQYTTVYHSISQYITVYHSTQYITVHYSMPQYMQFIILQYITWKIVWEQD